MHELQIFANPEFGNVRTLDENSKPLFCGSDIAKALGYAKPQNAIAAHCKGVTKRDTPTNGGEQAMRLFLYDLLKADGIIPAIERGKTAATA